MSGIPQERPASESSSETFSRLARFAIVVNARIASAESFGGGFPSVPLYATFRAFDYIAAARMRERPDAGDPDKVTPDRYLDLADAMLCLAYLHASSLIGEHYKDGFAALCKRYSSVDISSCVLDSADGQSGPLGRLEEARHQFANEQERFERFFKDYWPASFEEQGGRVASMSRAERDELVSVADAWVAASKRLYKAMCLAVPIYEDALTRTDALVDTVERATEVVDSVLLAAEALELGGKFGLI